MEKTKDFFYYIGDFLACIVILSLMYFLISWKLGDSLPVSYETGKSASEASKTVEETKVVINSGNTATTENKGKKDANITENKGGTKENKDTDKPGTEVKPNKSDAVGKIIISVQSGMSGVDIAYMLEEKGLVESADLFIAKLESMELAGSLLAGDFELNKGMSYEEIALKLTGN